MDALYAAIVLGSIGLVLSILIGICGKILITQKDDIVEEIYDLLPKINCGGCGNPSCIQMAEKLLQGESIENCRPCSLENKQIISKKIEEIKKKHKK